MYDYEVPQPVTSITLDTESFQPVAEQFTNKLRGSTQQVESGVTRNDLAEVSELFFGQVMPIALNQDKQTFSLALTIDNTDYIIPAKKDKALVEIPEEETTLFSETSDTIPTLIIKNPERFLVKVRELKQVFTLKEYRMDWLKMSVPGRYFSETKPVDFPAFMAHVWWSATEADFANPEEYLEHVKNAMTDESFERYDTVTLLGELPSLEDSHRFLVVQRREALNNYETPYQLMVALVTDPDEPNFKSPGTLASVRYTRDSQEHAEIYAFQNPKLTWITEREVQEDRDIIENQEFRLMNLFRENMIQYNDLWRQYIGSVDELILEEDPETFCIKLYELIDKDTQFFSKQDAFWEKLKGIPQDGEHMPFLEIVIDKLHKLEDLKKDKAEFDFVKDRPQERQQLRRVVTRDLNRSISEGYLRNIEVTNLISALTIMTLFKKDGVKEVTVNLHMPLRWQEHNSTTEEIARATWGKSAEEIEETATDRFAFTLVRLTNQVKGIEVVGYPEDVGKLTLRLTEDSLQSDWPLLQDVIDAANE